MDRLSAEFFRRVRPNELEQLPRRFGEATSRWQRDQLNKQIRAAVGVDVLGDDPQLAKRVAGFVAENVALIRSVPNKYFDDVEKRVLAGVNAGLRHEEIARDLQERFHVAESSAKLIARDQVGKFYGQLNEARQTDLGVTGYVWRTANDSRVREEHAEREGQDYSWADPPFDGHPGEAINCRCYAEPVLGRLLQQLGE